MRMILAAMLAMTVAGCAMFDKAHNAYDAWNAGSVATNVVVASGGSNTATQGAKIDLSLPLCDPPHKYDDPKQEGTSIGRDIRYCVWVPSKNGYWYLRSLGDKGLRWDGKNVLAVDFIDEGYGYHAVGAIYGKEPRATGHTPGTDMSVTGQVYEVGRGRIYVITECRKVQ